MNKKKHIHFLKSTLAFKKIIFFLFFRYDYNFFALCCVAFHDFLDHLDGIVAKVQRVTYPNHDDPLLGGFLDAFCDKIVNVLSIWTIIQMTSFDSMCFVQSTIFLTVCYGVITYECIIGVVRVDDFFLAKIKR
jgi:phosphatidylglycerophosphate synthase